MTSPGTTDDQIKGRWRRRVALLVPLALVAASAGALTLAGPASASTTLTVCASGCTYTAIQPAVNGASSGDTISVAAGTYDAFSVTDKTDITIVGAGAGSTTIAPSTLISSGVTHKYTSNMQVSVLVNNSSNVTLEDMTVTGNGSAPGAGGPDALVFWNGSTGTIHDSDITGDYTINGSQTGQGIAVDGSSGTVSLDVTDTNISGFQKNGIDVIDGNGAASGATDTTTVTVTGGSITGAGATSTIAQNGIVAWNRGGGSVTATVDGTSFSDFGYTTDVADAADGILAYGGGAVTSVKNSTFTNFSQYSNYLATISGSPAIDATDGNTFGGVSPASATFAQLAAIQNMLQDEMMNDTVSRTHATALVSTLPNTVIATTGNDGIQAAVNDASAGDTVDVTAGTYAEQVTISKSLTLLGAQAGVDARTRSGAESVVKSISISTSNVSVDGFSFNGTASQVSVNSSTTLSGLVIQNDIFNGYGSVGLPIYDAGNIMVQKNLFENPSTSSEAIQFHSDTVQGGCNGSQVLDNVFSAATNNGGADVNFSCTSSNSTGVTVSGNVSTGDTGGSSFTAFSGVDGGISVTHNTGTTDGSTVFFFGNVTGSAVINSNMFTSGGSSAVSIHGADITSDVANTGTFTITSNTLTGNVRGVYVASSALGTGASVEVHFNDLSGNSTAGVTNDSSVTVNATQNWWGSSSGPYNANTNASGTGSSVSANVNYSNWCVYSGCVTPPPPAGTTTGTVDGGGSFASDPAGTVPTAVNPVVVSITSPAAGSVSIVKGITSPAVGGYSALGVNVQISAPLATVAQPLELTFQVFVGVLPSGAYPSDVTVFRDSTPLPACPGATTANPDPCVSSSSTAGGVETFTVLSSHASSWDLEAAMVGRLAGADRFGTAVAVSQAEFPGGKAGAVVLARGDDYPDALVAGPLAAAKNAPLLLTVGGSLPTVSKAELQRVLPTGGTVYILGGTGAVPASVATQLTDLGYQVVRYGGADRFGTAVQVADALGDPGTVLLATGTNFPDALSAGVAAAKAAGVVLLTNGTSLPAATSSYLAAHGKTVYAVGGPAAAADSSATALVGADRYATSVAVAVRFFPGPSSVGVASGTAFPDALSGGALLAHEGVPLVLAAPGSLPAGVGSYLSGVKSSVTSAHLFGGIGALGAAVQTAVGSTLGR